MSSSPKSSLNHQGYLSSDAPGETLQVDLLLSRFFDASDEADSQLLAAQLISDHAEQIIRGIIRYKLRFYINDATAAHQDAEDLYSEAVLELLTRLRDLKTNPKGQTINNFSGFVAVITYRVCSAYLRRKNPQRASLKNKLRYILTRAQGLALWKSDEQEEEWLCGFAVWQGHTVIRPNARLRQLLDDPHLLEQTGDDVLHTNLGDLAAAIFRWADGPVRFDDLVNIVGDLLRIKDHTPESNNREDSSRLDERLPDPRANVADEVEQRIYLQHIWAEIGELPLRQRTALLLNLTDRPGRSVIALLPATGIASFQEIAETLGMSAEQLADVWNDLPLDDSTIAVHLGASRQQVANLRKAARERLMRRRKLWNKNYEVELSGKH